MPSPNSCQTAQSSLATTKALHQEFAAAYALATQTRDRADVERAWELKMGIDASLAEFAEANKTLTVPRLVPNIFAHWPSFLETIKVTELDKEFTRISLEIGGRSEEELLDMLKDGGFEISPFARSMMEHDDFKRSLRIPNPREPDFTKWQLKPQDEIKLICLSVADLGLAINATTDQIYARAVELGLELCSPEVSPQLRLQYADQPMNEYIYVGMQQITDINSGPSVFGVASGTGGRWFLNCWAGPDRKWDPDDQFLFRLPKNT